MLRAHTSSRLITVTLIVALSVFTQPSRADFTLVYESKGNPMIEGQFTLRMKGEMTRLDTPTVTTITNTAKDEIFMLQHETKTAMKLSAGMAGNVGTQKAPAGTDAKPEITPTGRKETINGYSCEEYTVTQTGVDIVYWLAKDFPLKDELLHQSTVLNKNMGMETFGIDPKSLPGFPIRTVFKTPNGEINTTLVSADANPVDSKVFDIPTGYKEFNVPGGTLPIPNP